jgi:hypothetical protein
LAIISVIDAADVNQDFELELGRVAERTGKIEQVLRPDAVTELARRRRQTLDASAEPRFDRACE